MVGELALPMENIQTTHKDLPSLLQSFVCIDVYLAQSALLEVLGMIGMTKQKNSGGNSLPIPMIPEY